MRNKTIRNIQNGIIYISLSAIMIILVFPFIWMTSTAFKSSSDIFSAIPTLIPQPIYLGNFYRMWVESKFYIYVINSVIVAVSTTVIAVFFSTLSAYSLARFKYKGRALFMNLLLIAQMFPMPLLIISIYIIFVRLALVDSLVGLVIAYCTFAIPFSIIMLKSYFDSLPIELEESAAIDGCSPLGTIFRIVVPLSAPAITATGLFAFILAWQEFLIALTVTRTTEIRTITVAINLMVGFREIFWGPLMAATFTITLPVVVLFVYFQKHFISGMTLGAVKG